MFDHLQQVKVRAEFDCFGFKLNVEFECETVMIKVLLRRF